MRKIFIIEDEQDIIQAVHDELKKVGIRRDRRFGLGQHDGGSQGSRSRFDFDGHYASDV